MLWLDIIFALQQSFDAVKEPAEVELAWTRIIVLMLSSHKEKSGLGLFGA